MVSASQSIAEGSSLVISGVKKSYRAGDGSEVQALNGISLLVEPGELISLIGPSGCGKSTLLRLWRDWTSPVPGS